MRSTLSLIFVSLFFAASFSSAASPQKNDQIQGATCSLLILPLESDDYRDGEVIDEVYTDILSEEKGFDVVGHQNSEFLLWSEHYCYNAPMVGRSCILNMVLFDQNGNKVGKAQSDAVLAGFGGVNFSQAIRRLPICSKG